MSTSNNKKKHQNPLTGETMESTVHEFDMSSMLKFILVSITVTGVIVLGLSFVVGESPMDTIFNPMIGGIFFVYGIAALFIAKHNGDI